MPNLIKSCKSGEPLNVWQFQSLKKNREEGKVSAAPSAPSAPSRGCRNSRNASREQGRNRQSTTRISILAINYDAPGRDTSSTSRQQFFPARSTPIARFTSPPWPVFFPAGLPRIVSLCTRRRIRVHPAPFAHVPGTRPPSFLLYRGRHAPRRRTTGRSERTRDFRAEKRNGAFAIGTRGETKSPRSPEPTHETLRGYHGFRRLPVGTKN